MAWKVAEYICGAGHRHESLETAPPRASMPCPECGEPAALTISAPMVQQHSGKALYSIQRGERQETPPGCLDTRQLAKG